MAFGASEFIYWIQFKHVACRVMPCRAFCVSDLLRVVSCRVGFSCVSCVSCHACQACQACRSRACQACRACMSCKPCVSCVSNVLRVMRVACHACCLACVLRVMRVVSTPLLMRVVSVRVGNMRVMRVVSCFRRACYPFRCRRRSRVRLTEAQDLWMGVCGCAGHGVV